jgi:hypothetical protein
MGRLYDIVRRTPFDLSNLDGSVEVVLAEFDNGVRIEESGEIESFRGIVALISLSDSADAKKCFAALAGSIEFAEISIHRIAFAACCEFLATRVAALDADWIDIIVYIGANEGFCRSDVQALIDTLDQTLSFRLALKFVVADGANDLQDWNKVTGCIGGKGDYGHIHAARTFIAVTSLGAPYVHACVDHVGVRALFSENTKPATTVEAIWIRESEQLLFSSTADQMAIGESGGMLSILSAAERKPLKDFDAFLNAVLAQTNTNAEPIFLRALLGVNLMGESRRHEGIAHAIFICVDRLC